MVLIQLFNENKDRKKLISCDKDAKFKDVRDQIAEKYQLLTLDGYVVSQLDSRDGDPVEDMLPHTKLGALPKLGGGTYLWVRPANDDTPPEFIVGTAVEDPSPESIVGATSPWTVPRHFSVWCNVTGDGIVGLRYHKIGTTGRDQLTCARRLSSSSPRMSRGSMRQSNRVQ